MHNRTDHELVDAVRRGDTDAFAALYDRYADRVHTFAYSRLRDPADSADALQTTFITAHRRLEQLADPARFRPWLFAIARTTIIDVGRDRTRRSSETSVDAGTMPELAGGDRAPGRDLEAEESAALLWQAADGLQPRDQELLELHLREGLDGADLAEAMNVEPGHVYVMVKRLKERLGTAVGSLLVARRGRDECADLDRLLGAWDGQFSLDIRSRVTRHVEGCDTCRDTRKAAIGWEQIAAAMPRVPAPTSSRLFVLGATTGTIATVGTATTGLASTSGAAGGVLTTTASVVGSIAVTIGMLAWPVVGVDQPDSDVAGIVETVDDPTSTTTLTTAPTTTTTTVTTPAAPTSTSAAPSTTTTSSTTTPPPRPRPTTTTTTVSLGPGPTITAPPPPASTTTAPPSTMPPSTTAPTTTTTTSTTTTTTAPPTTTTTTSPPTTTTTTTTVPVVGPILATSATEVAFGALLDTVTVPLSNTGDQALAWDASIPAGLNFLILGPDAGTIAPGESDSVTVVFDRSAALPEGDYPATPANLTLSSPSGAPIELPLSAAWEREPGVGFTLVDDPVFEDAGVCAGGAAGLPISTGVIASIAEESGIVGVTIEWDGFVLSMDADPTDPSGITYTATIGSLPGVVSLAAGTFDVTVVATDTRGNTGVLLREDVLVIVPCPN